MLTILVLACGVMDATRASPYCEKLEYNHVVGPRGERFTQAIAWDWDHEYRRWNAQAWVAAEDYHRYGQGVLITTASGEIIDVRCRYFHESWTEHDPEVENRRLFNCKYRRKVW